MIHKFCENHLSQLYEAIKAGDIADIEKIEHELSPIEECVACAYALKARGTAREILMDYLKTEGFAVDVPKKIGFLSLIWFWGIRIILVLLVFFPLFFIFQRFTPPFFSFIIAFTIAIFAFIFIDQIFD